MAAYAGGMRALALVVVVSACHPGAGDDSYQIIPGGDDTIITPQVDAPRPDSPSGDGGGTLAGRVCLLPDPRDLTACAASVPPP